MSSRSLPPRTTPSSRSRSVGRPGHEDGASNKLPSRSPLPSTPRIPSSQNARPQGLPRPSRQRTDDSRTPSTSASSASTSGSSFLDRMKVRSETSSRTSLEDDYEQPPKREGGWAPARGRKAPLAEEEQSDEDTNDRPADSNWGYGYDLWGRVSAVASNLTVNVSQAWQKSIHLADGEETPPGQESRLTKTMKAYHLDRARSPADLPAWLFDERERGIASKSWNVSKTEDYEERFLPDRELDSRQRSGLRDIYDRASSSAPSASRKTPAGLENAGDGGSRATNRLKAIRDAKRSAVQARSEPELPRVNSSDDRSLRMAPARVGLPAGPGRMRRQ